MATNTSGGTTTSFNNTPQAVDDYTTAYEDAVFTFNVMANDLGGSAKILWSIDDTTKTDDSGNGTIDLLTQDGTPTSIPEYSDLGARIWIENGVVKYDSNTIDFLSLGQKTTDKFTYAIRLANGTLSWATVYVELTGTNDVVSITSASVAGSVVEDVAASATTSGSIAFTDIDLADIHSASFAQAPGETHLGTFSLAPVSEAPNAAGGSVGWTYTINEAAAQYLADGQSVTEHYIVTLDDGHGSTTTQTVTVTITGTNDVVSVTSASASGAVVEDSASTPSPTDSNLASGTIAFTDVDLADSHSASFAADPTNSTALGLFALGAVSEAPNAAGGSVGWTYTINEAAAQYLADGQSVTEHYIVTLDDGHGSTTTQTVTVTITGTNDQPDIKLVGTDSASAGVNETDAGLSASGTLTVFDADTSDTVSVAVSSVVASGSGASGAPGNSALLAMLSLTGNSGNAADGTAGSLGWSFNSGSQAFDYLASGETLVLTYTLSADDHHLGSDSEVVTVTITGTNDAPVLTIADASGALTEDAADPTLSDSGALSFSDADATDLVTISTSYNGDAVWSGGSLSAAQLSAITGGFSADANSWDYSVANAALQFLAAGETITLSFTVTATDDSGQLNDSDSEVVTVTITGTNDQPDIKLVGTDSASAGVNETDAGLTASGTLTVADPDTSDTVDVSVTSVAASGTGGTGGLTNPQLLAMLSLSGNSGNAADGTAGSLGWSFNSGSQAFDYLANGETLVLTYTLSADDHHLGSDSQTVTVTITGTNDLPTITSSAQSGTVVEDSAQTPSLTDSNQASGTISFSDVDLSDGHAASFAQASGETHLGTFSLAAVSEAANAATGSVGWTYTISEAAAQYLAAGESVTEHYVVTVDDGYGGSAQQTVAVTITGTNDDPTITVADTDASGAVTEDSASPTLSDTGTIAFNDVDLIDVHSTSVTAAAGNTLGGTLSMGAVSEDAATAAGSVGWTYQVANSATQYLAAGETATEQFTVTVSDGHGGTASQLVTVTITGTNDQPDIKLVAGDKAADTLPETNATLSTSGTLTVFDADTSDTVSVAVSSVVASGSGASGAPGNSALLAMLSLTGNTANAADGTAGSLGWSFASTPTTFDYLAVGESLVLTYTLTGTDSSSAHATDTQTVTVTITGTNDAPTVAAALSSDPDEADSSYTMNLLQGASDVDHGETATLSVSNVSYQVDSGPSSTTAPAGLSLTGSTLTVDPTNAAFDHLAAGETMVITVSYNVTDVHGASVPQTATITVHGTNDSPYVQTAIADQHVNEDAAWSFTVPAGSFADPDTNDTLTYSATFANGDALPSWLSFSAATHSFSGTPPADFNGTISLKVTVTDGGSLSASDTFDLIVDPVNDAPVNTLPAAFSTNEDTPLKLAGLLVSDVDAASAAISVTLSVGSGTLSAANGGGVTVLGSGGSSITLSGSQADINAYLANVSSQPTFTPVANANGAVSLTMTTSDNGNSGSGGALGDNDISTIDITSVNDAPAGTDGSVTTAEDTAKVLTAADFGFTDPNDSPGNAFAFVKITTLPGSGTLTLNSVAVTAGQLVSVADINAGVLVYAPAANANGSTSFTFQVQDDGGTANGGVNLDPSANTLTINVTAVDDAPVNGVPGAQSVNEDAALVFSTGNGNAISISDVDAGTDPVEVTLSVAHGTLTLGSLAGLSVTGGANGTSTITVQGTQAAINAALQGLSYQGNSNFNGADSLSIVTSDLGYNGSGGPLTDTDSVAITVNAMNDAPVASGSATLGAIAEDTAAPAGATVSSLFSGNFSDAADQVAGGSSANTFAGIAISDYFFQSSKGSWQYSTDGGGSWTSFSSAVSNAALTLNATDLLRFVPAADYNGPAPTLGANLIESGQAIISGARIDLTGATGGTTHISSGTVTLSETITAVNDAPVNTLPASFTTNEDTSVKLAGLFVGDVDVGGGTITVTLSVASGTLTAADGPGVTASGSGTGTITLTGTQFSLNTYLGNAASQPTYAPLANANGAVTLTMTTSDNGNSGSGGAQGDTDISTINIASVNDAPAGTNATLTINEDTPRTLAAADFGFSDPSDSPANALAAVRITTLPSAGSLTLNGVAVTAGQFVSVADINSGLLVFTPSANANGTAYSSFTFQVQDNGGTANGGVDLDQSANTLTFNVTAVNDAPVATITPTTYAATEQVNLNLHGTGLSISDVDAASGSLTVTLAVSEGNLNLAAGTTGAGISNNGTSSVTITGTLAQINNLLAGNNSATIVYNDNTDTPSASATLTLTVHDNGNTGGGDLSSSDTATINITAVNDGPVNTIPASFATNEDTSVKLAGLSVSDADAASGPISVTLSVASGTLSAASGGNVTVSGSGTGNLVLSGTTSDINAYLASASNQPTYVPAANVNGAVTLTMTSNDGGNTGSGGAQSDTDVSTINVAAVNDAPALDLNGAAAGTSATLSYTAGSAASPISPAATVTDIDSPDFSGGSLTVGFTGATGTSADQLTIQNQGTGAGQIGVSGSNVTFGGVVIGSFTGGANGSNLVISFNASATQAAVQALSEHILYSNATSGTTTKTLSYTVIDGDGTANGGADTATATATINVTGSSLPPVVDLNGGAAGNDLSVNYAGNNNTAPLILAPSATVTDPDSANLTSLTAVLTGQQDDGVGNVKELLSLSAGAQSAATTAGLTVNFNTTNGTLTITGSATVATYQTILEGIQYADTKTGAHNAGPRTLTITASDGTNTSAPHTVTISVAKPAGTAGSPINLALDAPDGTMVTVHVKSLPDGWSIAGAVQQADGSWMLQTTNVSSLTVTTPAGYSGAEVLAITATWTNADGSAGIAYISDNVEAYAPGTPIFAWSGDDTLTGSSGADEFVFSQPIGRDVVHSFDASADRIDLIGYDGISSFADVQSHLSEGADGSAVVTLADGQSITLEGVSASSLTAANFEFNVTPTVTNAATIAIGDGALLPMSGTINNSGTIALDAGGATTVLQLIQNGITLQGGGHVILSDSSSNLITATLPSVTFNNVDNIISGAGNLGGGSMMLTNGGTIIADGLSALVIDTGANAVVNTGTIEANGLGGLQISGSIVNDGLLLAQSGSLTIGGDLGGSGHVQVDGSATIEFADLASNDIALGANAAGLIIFDHAEGFSGSISGLNGDDRIDLRDLQFGESTAMSYVDNGSGSGVLTITDGVRSIQLHLNGIYQIGDFMLGSDGNGGSLLTNTGGDLLG